MNKSKGIKTAFNVQTSVTSRVCLATSERHAAAIIKHGFPKEKIIFIKKVSSYFAQPNTATGPNM